MFHRRNEIINGLNQLPRTNQGSLGNGSTLQECRYPTFFESDQLAFSGKRLPRCDCVSKEHLKSRKLPTSIVRECLRENSSMEHLHLVDDKMPVLFVMTKDSIYPVRKFVSSSLESSKCIRTNNSKRWKTYTVVS